MFSINLRFPLAITIAVLMSALNFAGAVTEHLLAGSASVDLTPPLEMKVALGGYGERMSKPALGIHDAVRAKALVLEQGGRRFVLVTADILAFPPGFKTLVMDRLSADGWSSDQIMLLPSHSHTSFDMMTLHPGNSKAQFASWLWSEKKGSTTPCGETRYESAMGLWRNST